MRIGVPVGMDGRAKPGHDAGVLCARPRALPLQHEHRLRAEQVPQPPRRADAHRLAVAGERDAALDAGADFVEQADEIADRAEMDVRRLVPGVVQRVGPRHAAAKQQLQPHAPMTEIRKRHDGAPADAQHVLQHDPGLACRLQGLRQDDVVERVVRVVGEVCVGVALDHR